MYTAALHTSLLASYLRITGWMLAWSCAPCSQLSAFIVLLSIEAIITVQIQTSTLSGHQTDVLERSLCDDSFSTRPRAGGRTPPYSPVGGGSCYVWEKIL